MDRSKLAVKQKRFVTEIGIGGSCPGACVWTLRFDETFADTPEKKRMSIRIHFILVLIFVVHAVVFGVLWASGAGLVFLFCSGLNAIGAAYLWRSYRPKSTHCGELRGRDA